MSADYGIKCTCGAVGMASTLPATIDCECGRTHHIETKEGHICFRKVLDEGDGNDDEQDDRRYVHSNRASIARWLLTRLKG